MEKEKVSNSTGLEQEIKEQAELYAGMQLWMNDGGDEHLFHEHIAKTSFLACAQWMQEREKWISVEERLPENNKHHNVLLNGDRNSSHHIYYVAGYDNLYKQWLNPFGDKIEEKVTHWKHIDSL